MGHCRPRHLVFGLLVLVAVLWSQTASGSGSVPARVLRGDVTAAGDAGDAEGWRVAHPAPGVYLVVVPGADVSVDVPSWNIPADVTIIPSGGGAAEIRFHTRGVPVDVDFELVITLHG